MMKIDIPSYKNINIKYIVFDYNGTLAVDGIISDKIKKKLSMLSELVDIYVLTADTYGNVKENMKDINVKLHIISKKNGVYDKLQFIKQLGTENCIAVGNGNNDELMLKEAILGICIIGDEGCSVRALQNSDLVVRSIDDCLDLFLNPTRLKATLRG